MDRLPHEVSLALERLESFVIHLEDAIFKIVLRDAGLHQGEILHRKRFREGGILLKVRIIGFNHKGWKLPLPLEPLTFLLLVREHLIIFFLRQLSPVSRLGLVP